MVSKAFITYWPRWSLPDNISNHPNGVDLEFEKAPSNVDYPKLTKPKIVVYAGNIGHAQGLSKILPLLAKMSATEFTYKIIGNGSDYNNLVTQCRKLKIENISFIKPMSRKDLLNHYKEAHLLFLHLDDKSAFQKVLPSKIFEYAATGLPILAGVKGYPAQFLRDEVLYSYVFDSLDIEAAWSIMNTIRYDKIDRSGFVSKFNRKNISSSLVEEFLTNVG